MDDGALDSLTVFHVASTPGIWLMSTFSTSRRDTAPCASPKRLATCSITTDVDRSASDSPREGTHAVRSSAGVRAGKARWSSAQSIFSAARGTQALTKKA